MSNHSLRATRSVTRLFAGVLSICAAGMALNASAQTTEAVAAAVPQITQAVDNASKVTLPGTVHPLAQAKYDRGAVPSSFQAPRVQMMLQRPPEREEALKKFIASANDKSSPSYHKWVTPDQFGKLYGPADSDVQQVTAWMQSQGLTVNKINRGRSIVEFGGSAAQIQAAFGTSIHAYVVNGETHYANATPIQIPAALKPAIKGIASLNNFKLHSSAKVLGTGTYSPKTHKGTANWNYPEGTTSEFFYVAPGDLAVEYDTAPLLTAGTNGAGVTIGIINDSNVDTTLFNAYRTLFNLPATTLQVTVDGNDPGVNSDSIEAYLDVEQSGAVAPGATLDLYVGESSALSNGLDLATVRAVDDDTAQVLNLSFGACEFVLGASGNAFYNQIWEEAAAQGQTVLVSSGDSGSEACYPSGYYGLSVSGTASTPYNIAVGGTDFYYSDYTTPTSNGLPASFNSFWNPATTSTTPTTSITGYIPEQPWNGSVYGLNLATYGNGGASPTPEGGGGGASSCTSQTPQNQCIGGYAKPSYQSSVTPADTVRDIPDVSLFASNGFNYSAYPICASPGDCNTDGQSSTPATVTGIGGTSASAPAFAGIMAMVVQKYGAQGQANYTLYPLQKQFPAAFHDVTAGSNNEPCDPTSQYDLTACTADSSGGGTYSVQDYAAAAGYDEASGLGSVDANVLVSDWNKVSFTSTTTALTVNPTTITHGASVTLSAAVTSSSATGDVAFISSTPLPNNKSLGFGTLASGVASVTSPSSTVSNLPGGTYNITAQYEGDGTYAPSTSTAQSITVNPENSTTYENAFNYYQGEVIATGATNVPYGTSIAIEAQPVGTAVSQTSPTVNSLNSDGVATGNVVFTDGSLTATEAINAFGVASWNPGTFVIGPHSVTAKFSGDASFNASTSAATTFTVIKGTPLVNVVPTLTAQQTGQNLTVQVKLCNAEATGTTPPTGCGLGAGLAPTGSVTVTAGSQTQTATLAAFNTGSGIPGISTVGAGNYSIATVTFPSVPAGVTSVTASYSGDSNWNTTSGSAAFSTAAGSLTHSTTTLTVTPATGTNNATAFSFTSVITGTGTLAPTGEVTILNNGTSLGSITLTASPGQVVIAGDVVTVTFSVSGINSDGGTNQFVAVYSGDTTYAGSSSTAASGTADQSDFNLSTQNAAVTIAAGSSGTAAVNLNSIAGFNSAVNLTCSSPITGITCTVNPGSVTVNGPQTATVTINVASNVAGNNRLRLWLSGGGAALACVLFLGIPARRRNWRSMLGMLCFVVLTANIGCGGGGGSSSGGDSSTGTTATPVFSPAGGTYSTAQTVTITDSTAGATIYFTTDGSTPTTSSAKYTAALAIGSSGTVKAIASSSGNNNSAVAAASYVISAAGGGSGGAGTAVPSNVVTITGTSTGPNPETHNVTIQVAVQ